MIFFRVLFVCFLCVLCCGAVLAADGDVLEAARGLKKAALGAAEAQRAVVKGLNGWNASLHKAVEHITDAVPTGDDVELQKAVNADDGTRIALSLAQAMKLSELAVLEAVQNAKDSVDRVAASVEKSPEATKDLKELGESAKKLWEKVLPKAQSQSGTVIKGGTADTAIARTNVSRMATTKALDAVLKIMNPQQSTKPEKKVVTDSLGEAKDILESMISHTPNITSEAESLSGEIDEAMRVSKTLANKVLEAAGVKTEEDEQEAPGGVDGGANPGNGLKESVVSTPNFPKKTTPGANTEDSSVFAHVGAALLFLFGFRTLEVLF